MPLGETGLAVLPTGSPSRRPRAGVEGPRSCPRRCRSSRPLPHGVAAEESASFTLISVPLRSWRRPTSSQRAAACGGCSPPARAVAGRGARCSRGLRGCRWRRGGEGRAGLCRACRCVMPWPEGPTVGHGSAVLCVACGSCMWLVRPKAGGVSLPPRPEPPRLRAGRNRPEHVVKLLLTEGALPSPNLLPSPPTARPSRSPSSQPCPASGRLARWRDGGGETERWTHTHAPEDLGLLPARKGPRPAPTKRVRS